MGVGGSRSSSRAWTERWWSLARCWTGDDRRNAAVTASRGPEYAGGGHRCHAQHSRCHLTARGNPMPDLTESITVSAPATRCMAWSATCHGWASGAPSARRVTWSSRTPGPGVGARFVGHNRVGAVRWFTQGRVVDAVPGRRSASRSTSARSRSRSGPTSSPPLRRLRGHRVLDRPPPVGPETPLPTRLRQPRPTQRPRHPHDADPAEIGRSRRPREARVTLGPARGSGSGCEVTWNRGNRSPAGLLPSAFPPVRRPDSAQRARDPYDARAAQIHRRSRRRGEWLATAPPALAARPPDPGLARLGPGGLGLVMGGACW